MHYLCNYTGCSETLTLTFIYLYIQHRLLRMQQDVRLFLQSLPCRDTSIGMVEFSGNMTQSKITHPLARLDSDINMDTLIGAIPQGTLDRTCIGCGIRKAIQVLCMIILSALCDSEIVKATVHIMKQVNHISSSPVKLIIHLCIMVLILHDDLS